MLQWPFIISRAVFRARLATCTNRAKLYFPLIVRKRTCLNEKRGCRFPSPAVKHANTADCLRRIVSSGTTDQSLARLLVLRQRPQTAAAPFAAPSDEELVVRAQTGDRTALGILFDRYSELALGIGVRILRDRGEAEDLVQEVFLSLWDKVKGFDPSKGSGRTWIVQIAYRRAFDRRAYLFRRQFYDGTEVGRIKNTLQANADCEERIANLLTGEQLHAAFEELSEKQRTTLELYFFEGLDLREISARLAETLENTRHFYYRGLERLRNRAEAMAHRNGKRL
jgi:RNA polymerase sigma-70 factor, ECF subfamily